MNASALALLVLGAIITAALMFGSLNFSFIGAIVTLIIGAGIAMVVGYAITESNDEG